MGHAGNCTIYSMNHCSCGLNNAFAQKVDVYNEPLADWERELLMGDDERNRNIVDRLNNKINSLVKQNDFDFETIGRFYVKGDRHAADMMVKTIKDREREIEALRAILNG